jgi:hypothetical protein
LAAAKISWVFVQEQPKPVRFCIRQKKIGTFQKKIGTFLSACPFFTKTDPFFAVRVNEALKAFQQK